MSAQTQFQADLKAEQIPADALAYVGARARNRFYDFVLKRFTASGMTKAELARKIGKGPDRVNRLLGAPGNWTIETVAELLAGISGEEILPNAQDFFGRTCSNMSQEQLLGHLIGAVERNEIRPVLATTKIQPATFPAEFFSTSSSSGSAHTVSPKWHTV